MSNSHSPLYSPNVNVAMVGGNGALRAIPLESAANFWAPVRHQVMHPIDAGTKPVSPRREAGTLQGNRTLSQERASLRHCGPTRAGRLHEFCIQIWVREFLSNKPTAPTTVNHREEEDRPA